MNNQLERLIADLCDADKRSADPQLQRAGELIIIQNVDGWYNSCNHYTELRQGAQLE